MSLVFANALHEITLCIFTTLAPAAVLSCWIVGWPLLSKKLSYDMRYSITKAFSASLIIASTGLIASTTHLGNPSNALYVLVGIGRSPLSNEVFAACVFLFIAAVFWLIGFAEQHHRHILGVLYGLMLISGSLFTTSMAFAYYVDTILTWHISVIPATIFCNALFVGPLLGMTSIAFSKKESFSVMTERIYIALAMLGFVAGLCLYVIQGLTATSMSNYMIHMSILSPWYWAGLTLSAVLGMFSLGLYLAYIYNKTQHTKASIVVSCILGFGSIFIMRFLFYTTHMTVGLGF